MAQIELAEKRAGSRDAAEELIWMPARSKSIKAWPVGHDRL
jgi:hypothetical protein